MSALIPAAPLWDERMTEEDAHARGYASVEEWYKQASAVTPLGAGSAKADQDSMPPLPPPPDEEAYYPGRTASSISLHQDMEARVSSAADSEYDEVNVLSHPGTGCERALAAHWRREQPYLMVDVEPRSREREQLYALCRAKLAEQAKKDLG